MTTLETQPLLPNLTDAQEEVRSGIWPAQWIKNAIDRGDIRALNSISSDQIQPASLDLRLGSVAYRVAASFLPGQHSTVQDKVRMLAEEKLNLDRGAVLKRDCVYIVQLQETFRLKKRISAVANPKSSTGRLDVFARVITDYGTEFDNIRERYNGPLWAELAPRSFDVFVKEGSRLVQVRIKRGTPPSNTAWLQRLQDEVQLVRGDEVEPDIKKARIAVRVDIAGDSVSGLIGYKAKKSRENIDVSKSDYYDPHEFWERVYRPDHGGIILGRDDFYILASKGMVVVPPDHAADMVAYDTLVGEFRVHYAGFFDPGFGYSESGVGGTPAVLEVRSHEVPFMIEDGQMVGRLFYERLTEETDKPYGPSIGSSYQRQGLTLSKQFQRL